MRTIKKHDERKTEILDNAEKLFMTKGYERCTVNDILKAVNIAKGTFYYYFNSKREVLDAIVSRYIDIILNRIQNIIRSSVSPEEKFIQAFSSLNIQQNVGKEMMDELHKSENLLLHQNILKQIVLKIAPLLTEIVNEGIQKNHWICDFPLEYMQIFLTSAMTLIDEEFFGFDEKNQNKIFMALITILEKMLSVPEKSFLTLYAEHLTNS